MVPGAVIVEEHVEEGVGFRHESDHDLGGIVARLLEVGAESGEAQVERLEPAPCRAAREHREQIGAAAEGDPDDARQDVGRRALGQLRGPEPAELRGGGESGPLSSGEPQPGSRADHCPDDEAETERESQADELCVHAPEPEPTSDV
jgi:hypothetical protein